jgi:hypothetical protein
MPSAVRSSRLLPFTLLAAACGVPSAAPGAPAPQGASSAPPLSPAQPAPLASGGGQELAIPPGAGSVPSGECSLPSPLKSDDPCTSDADCGVSSPCHAKACVARAKSQPPKPDTMCTMSLECDTADANRCGCYEGRCALIPPAP